MESVLQVTANDELFMHDEQSPARTSIEKQRRRMEFRVGQPDHLVFSNISLIKVNQTGLQDRSEEGNAEVTSPGRLKHDVNLNMELAFVNKKSILVFN